MKLSDRLQTIANFVDDGETVADIGTDHGFLPIFLYENGKSSNVILSDIKTGPLEKAKDNINKFCPDFNFDIRLGPGLATIHHGEVDAIVIAGMGGLLIADILGSDIEKTRSFKKYILQPRNAQDKLRQWLVKNDFVILDEKLVREGKYICEIILTEPKTAKSKKNLIHVNNYIDSLDFEISPILFKNKDPLLIEFIQNKIRIEKKIIDDILKGSNNINNDKLKKAEKRIESLQGLMERSGNDEY